MLFPILFLGIGFGSALYEEKTGASYGSSLEKKCEYLSGQNGVRAAFIGDKCFVTSNVPYIIEFERYHELSQQCTHLQGFKARLAHIYNEVQMKALIQKGIVQPTESVYIGAKQIPDDEQKSIPMTNLAEHRKRWFYIDNNGNPTGPLNDRLFLFDEPNNIFEQVYEFVLTIWHRPSGDYGFNDENPGVRFWDKGIPILCEYEDVTTCPEGYAFVESKCIKAFSEPKTVSEAQRFCESERGLENAGLAFLNRYEVNEYVVKYLTKQTSLRSEVSGGGDIPVLFGLQFKGGKWDYPSEPAVFFNWFDKLGYSSAQEGDGAAFFIPARENSNKDGSVNRVGYWTPVKSSDRVPFICQGDPVVNV